jgi:predicted Zn-ribbon and HTH transcriptional regulator
VTDTAPPRKISAKAVLTDLKEGLSDAQLMERYGLSFQGLQDLFSKLIGAKLVTQQYLDNRAKKFAGAMGAKPVAKKTTCSFCGYQQAEKFARCPRCDHEVTEWLDTVELTKIFSHE